MRSSLLTRKCSACGLIKPISAFLLLKNGYNTICSDCQARAAEDDDSSSGGLRIDEKKKKLDELEQKKREEEAGDVRRKDWDNIDKIAGDTKEKREKTFFTERKHREEYLEKTMPEKQPGDKKAALTEAQKKLAAETGVLTEREALEAGVQKDTLETSERIKTGIDFTSPFVGQQVPQAKFHSAEFLKWLGTLTGNAPVKTFSTTQDAKAGQPNAAKAPSNVEGKPSKVGFTSSPAQSHKESENTEPLFRETEKVWGPSSKK